MSNFKLGLSLGSLLTSLAFCRMARADDEVDESALRNNGISAIYLQSDSVITHGKQFVVWPGKPMPIPLHAQVGVGNSAQEDVAGIKVRVRAFNEKNLEAGQINGPDKKDDIFLTGQPCTFTPPKPGIYRLTIEVLGADGRIIPTRGVYKDVNPQYPKTASQDLNLLVYRPPVPKLKISYDNWRATSGKDNLYERKISIEFQNVNDLVPARGYSYYVAREDVPRWLVLKLHVVPRVPLKNLSPNELKKICWITDTPVYFNSSLWYGTIATQYFLYEPTRDAPRDPAFYDVKVQFIGLTAKPPKTENRR